MDPPDTPTVRPADTVAAVAENYARLHRYGPEFGGDQEGNHGLTNHGPMAVEVMLRRGLDIDVDRWLDRYVRRLDELPTGRRSITDATWAAALGDHRRLPDWTCFFAAELRDRPWREVLELWWPRLLPGIVAGSTHGVIRVGHAVRTLLAGPGEPAPAALDELAHGLAFWAARYRRLPTTTLIDADRPAPGGIHGVPRLQDQTGVVAHRIDRLGTTPGWTTDPDSVDAGGEVSSRVSFPDPMTGLTILVDAATRAYLSYGHAAPVLLVHSATAPNAVAHVLPALPQRLWPASHAAALTASMALVAMYASAQPLPASEVAYQKPASAADALQRAADHGDEHVLKFTDTAVDAYQRRPDPDLLIAATHAAGLIAAPDNA